MEERDPKWKESGKAFIESVTTLLERLLDYRNALQVSFFLKMNCMLLYAKVQLEIGKGGNVRYSDVFCDNFGT